MECRYSLQSVQSAMIKNGWGWSLCLHLLSLPSSDYARRYVMLNGCLKIMVGSLGLVIACCKYDHRRVECWNSLLSYCLANPRFKEIIFVIRPPHFLIKSMVFIDFRFHQAHHSSDTFHWKEMHYCRLIRKSDALTIIWRNHVSELYPDYEEWGYLIDL